MASAVGDLVVRFGADTSRFNRGAGQVTRMLGGLKGAAMGLAGALGFTGGVYGFVNLLRAGENFNQKMRQSLAIMGDVSDAMKGKMEKAAFDVAKATRFSAAEAAESYYFLASAGLDAAQSIAALPQVAKFAQAGNFDMARATDLATDAQSALGLTVKDAARNLDNLTRVTDVLTKANTLANASSEQFSTALTTKAGAALRALGKDIEEGVAVLAAFADQGVKGEEAGTQLAIVLRDLQTKAIENKAAFTGAGIGVFDASGEMRNMADIIGDLEKKLGGLSDEQKKSTLLMLGFSDKSIGAMTALLGTSDKIREYEKALRAAGGTTQEVADKQLTSAQKAFAKLGAFATQAGVAIGAFISPHIESIIKFAAASVAAATAIWLVNRAIQSYTAFTKGAAIATAILQAMSGPKGWVTLAVGVAAAIVAVKGVSRVFSTVDTKMKAATESASQVPPPLQRIASQAGPITSTARATEHLADALKALPPVARAAAGRHDALGTSLNSSITLLSDMAQAAGVARKAIGNAFASVEQGKTGWTPRGTSKLAASTPELTKPLRDAVDLFDEAKKLQSRLLALSAAPGEMGISAKNATVIIESLTESYRKLLNASEDVGRARHEDQKIERLKVLQEAMTTFILAAQGGQATLMHMQDAIAAALGPFASLEEAVDAANSAIDSLATPQENLSRKLKEIEALFNLGLIGDGKEGLDIKAKMIAAAMGAFDAAIGGPKKHLADLRKEVEALQARLTPAQREFNRFADMPGIDPDTLNAIGNAYLQIEAITKRNALLDEAGDLKESMRSPAEALQARLGHYKELLEAVGPGFQDTYNRLIAEERDKLATKDNKQPSQQPAALERSSAEAWKKIISSMYGEDGDTDKATKETAANTRGMLAVLNRLDNREPAKEVDI